MRKARAVTLTAAVVHLASCDLSTPEPEVSVDVPQVEVSPAPPSPPSHDRLAFAPLALQAGVTEPTTTTTAWVGGEAVALSWSPLLKVGAKVGSWPFGRLLDSRGLGLAGPDGVCGYPDFSGVLPKAGGAWWLTHFECQPGGVALSDIAAAPDGTLTALSTKPVDFGSVDGTWVNCAGSVTPWVTHLGTEEFEPDARGFEPGAPIDKYWARIHRYHGGDPTVARPYHFGWMIEIEVDEEGKPSVHKRRAMGRFSHEIGVVLPDRRTVYMTDDARQHGGLFMFVADQADDLSAGRLYAARLTQTATELGGGASLAWVDLGHATESELEQLLDRDPRFDQLFDVAPEVQGACPEGSRRVVTASNSEPECLTLKEGMDKAASRLETRRYAAWLGATTELVKGEGMAFDPDEGRVYVALSAIVGSAAGEGEPTDTDHLVLPQNPCGGVYALDLAAGQVDTTGQPIDSPHVATSLEGLVVGRLQGKGCAPDGLANPDNLAYLPGHRALMIAEDTRGHDVAMLWHFDTLEKTLTRVQTAPAKAEVTGLSWVPNLHGHGYLAVTHQTDGDRPSEVGVLGPFPVLER